MELHLTVIKNQIMNNTQNDFISGIGNTPLIKLRAASEITGCNIYGKAEFLNPGGSVKDRAALALLKDAQDKGYAESDPTLDINGEDSAHKLSILNSIIFSEIPSFKSIHIRGIENIDLIDHHYSSEFGYNIRLIALSQITDNGVYKEVTPMLVDKDSSLGRVDEANNIIKIIGQESGDVVLEGQGAGEGPTSSSVISDLIDCATAVSYTHLTLPTKA